MKSNSLVLQLFFLFLVGGTAVAAEKTAFDVATPDKRRAVLEVANQLAKPGDFSGPLTDLVNPFDPKGFAQGDADERAAELAAARSAGQATVNRAPNDRELLEAIASQILPTGTAFIGNQPILYLFKKPVKIGAKFKVPYSGVDYILELTAIDRTTFTLRYNGEEIIRPISKTGK